MEIYTNSADRKAYLSLPVTPVADSLDVVIRKPGYPDFTAETVVAETAGLAVTIPFYMVQDDGRVSIEWSFDYLEGTATYPFVTQTYVDVVTPYVSLTEVEHLVDDEDLDTEDYKDIERATRFIINAHTGQNFGRQRKTLTTKGTGTSVLRLPARLISVEAFNGVVGGGSYFEVTGDGWYLQYATTGVPPLRADYWGLHMHRGGVIHNPNNVSLNKFLAGETITIKGTWGFESVPEEVKEAARLLIYDYATGDTVYRDRYLTSMTAADWRIQFNSGAFARTGNVRADQLLSNFVLQRGWVVI